MTLFNLSHSFYVDKTAVANCAQVSISSIGLYFMYRPNPYENTSTLANPGITLMLTDVVQDVPNIANSQIFVNATRCEWNEISSSSDASVETRFTFKTPIIVNTDQSYAFILSFDGNEDFVPWTNIKGNKLVGTTDLSPGPSSSVGGKFFQSTSIIQTVDDLTNSNLITAWNSLDNTTLKFNIYAARYAINGDPIIANTTLTPNTVVYYSNLYWDYDSGSNEITIFQPSPRVENISFNMNTSLKQTIVSAQKIYQKKPYWPGGTSYATVAVTMSNTITANSTTSNGMPFSWNNVFGSYTGEKYIVLQDYAQVDVRKVVSIISNTVIMVDEPTTFVNTASKFIISPIATVDSFNTSYINGQKTALMFLRDSNANSTVRFTGSSVNTANIVLGGTGYSNNDIMYVIGYENIPGKVYGNFAAVANIATNTSGGITSLSLSSIGAGFTNSASIRTIFSNTVITPNNTIANTSGGSGANISIIIGSTLMTDQANNVFNQCQVLNIPPSDCTVINNNLAQTSQNVSLSSTMSFLYYANVDFSTSTGYGYYVSTPPQVFNLDYNKRFMLNQNINVPTIMSRSNEFVALYSNGAINNQANSLLTFSNNYVVSLKASFENDYSSLGSIYGPTIEFGRYIINNDYSYENTNNGNALARYLTTVINFTGLVDSTRMAEDLRIYLTAYRPPNSSFQVFARIQNSGDSEAFDDEDWTRLELIDGDIYSSLTDSTSYVEMTWGFQPAPNTVFTLAGYASTANNSATITGIGTTFSANLAANNLIKIYSPLFPEENFAVVSVNSITSNTSLTVDQVFSTNTIFGIGGPELADTSGLLIDLLGWPNQAFNNIQNDNVVRYYNMSNHIYDNFNILQIKVCSLSADPRSIPRIHNIRSVSLSA